MKKLLVVLMVALLAVALVACGGNDDTTPKTETTTDPTVTTTTPGADETTKAPDADETTKAPDADETTAPTTTEEFAGYDMINEIMCVNQWTTDPELVFCTFENTHGDINFNVAVVFIMNDYDGIYQDLFYTETNPDGSFNTAVWEANDTYRWVFTVDGKEFECDGFSLFNNGSSGYVRASLGEKFSFDDYEYDEENTHVYEVSLKIYNDENEVEYFANFTEFGGMYHKKPAKVEMVVDTDRPTDLERVPFNQVTPISGPAAGDGEGYEKLFDNDPRSKLCKNANGIENAVTLSFASAQNIAGVSLVNGNDNEAYTSRTVLAFDIYVSEDGQNWGDPVVSFTGLDADGVALDKALYNKNYAENYFDFGKTLTGVTNVMVVINNGEHYQISELIFWQG
ncbi:MAG: hypothetical protein IKC63_07985 [Clostridia bacterium]|nr:hypothetical protein [Clostridia bacterium]